MSYRDNENTSIYVERWWETLLRRHLVSALFVAFGALDLLVFFGWYRGRSLATLFLSWLCLGLLVFLYSVFPAETDRSRVFGRGVSAYFWVLTLMSAWWIWRHS